MNLLAAGAQYLARVQSLTLATPIVLRRSGGGEVSLSARVKTVSFDVEIADGRVERWESRAFTVQASDVGEKPKDGDLIVETHALGTSTYRVVAPPGIPAVHFSDAYRTGYVIHSKLVQAAT